MGMVVCVGGAGGGDLLLFAKNPPEHWVRLWAHRRALHQLLLMVSTQASSWTTNTWMLRTEKPLCTRSLRPETTHASPNLAQILRGFFVLPFLPWIRHAFLCSRGSLGLQCLPKLCSWNMCIGSGLFKASRKCLSFLNNQDTGEKRKGL